MRVDIEKTGKVRTMVVSPGRGKEDRDPSRISMRGLLGRFSYRKDKDGNRIVVERREKE